MVVEKPEKNFIILESLSNEKQKILHVINTSDLLTMGEKKAGKESIVIGRGQDSDVRVVDDISVSRSHALIHKTKDGHYILSDNKSKFGTLVQVQYPIFLGAKLMGNQMMTLQSGKTIM